MRALSMRLGVQELWDPRILGIPEARGTLTAKKLSPGAIVRSFQIPTTNFENPTAKFRLTEHQIMMKLASDGFKWKTGFQKQDRNKLIPLSKFKDFGLVSVKTS